jgi:hypothetical protein
MFFAGHRASGPVFMFCTLGHVFCGIEGVGSRFSVLCTRIRFRLNRGRRVLFSCFARPEPFSAVPSASGPDFMFCTPRLVFGGVECVRSHFHVLRARTNFRRYRGHLVPFSYFALPKMFYAVPSASGFVRPDSFPTIPRALGPDFIFCAPGLVFGGTEGVGFRFHVLHVWTRFLRYRGHRVSFSCFVLPNSFSAVPRASGHVFTFSAPELIFGGTEGVLSRFHVLYAWTHFRRSRGR